MQRCGVIEESDSPWSSPTVKKKNGYPRFCVEYRKLNVAEKDCFPMPPIADTFDMLTGAKWFSSLDLKERLSAGGSTSGQGEDCVLSWSRAMAVHRHALWPLQRISDVERSVVTVL
jgi:hypothetical protein